MLKHHIEVNVYVGIRVDVYVDFYFALCYYLIAYGGYKKWILI